MFIFYDAPNFTWTELGLSAVTPGLLLLSILGPLHPTLHVGFGVERCRPRVRLWVQC